jgi:hypothetical protein
MGSQLAAPLQQLALARRVQWRNRKMSPVVECSSKNSRPVDEAGAEHSHALEVLLQWRLLRSAIERLKAAPDDTGPKLAA